MTRAIRFLRHSTFLQQFHDSDSATIRRAPRRGHEGSDRQPDSGVAAQLDELLRRVTHLARSLTGAEQAALALHATVDDAPRKYFSLGPAYAEWRDYRPDPKGLGLHGLEPEPGEVIRLTQAEVEAHPAWHGFGDQAGQHPPMRGWLATAICGDGGYRYGLLQLSDKAEGADFSSEDEVRVRELAQLTGAALDALRLVRAAR